MPIYEYQCRACGKVTDVRHGFDETNSQACPACGGELARRFSAAGIVFKGSGFYVTDSRKGSTASSSSSNSASETKSESSETKSETSETKSGASETKSSAPAPSDSAKSTPKTDTAAA